MSSAGSDGTVGAYAVEADEFSVEQARAFARSILAACDAVEGSAPTLQRTQDRPRLA